MSLRHLYDKFNGQVQFLVIYIREAHPTDGWNMGSEFKISDPKTFQERRKVAGMCEAGLQYGIRTYVDEMDDAVMSAYAAWPERLYLVDQNGRIAYAGGIGPFGFAPMELNQAINIQLKGEPIGT